jgi:hypothetical protein
MLQPGTKVRVTYAGVIEEARRDGSGWPRYKITFDQGWGYTWAQESRGEVIEVITDDRS